MRVFSGCSRQYRVFWRRAFFSEATIAVAADLGSTVVTEGVGNTVVGDRVVGRVGEGGTKVDGASVAAGGAGSFGSFIVAGVIGGSVFPGVP